MLVDDRLVPRVYAQAREPAHSGLNPVIMPYFHSTFDLAMTRVNAVVNILHSFIRSIATLILRLGCEVS